MNGIKNNKKVLTILFIILFILIVSFIYNFYLKEDGNVIIKKIRNDEIARPDINLDDYEKTTGKYELEVYKVSSRYSRNYDNLCLNKSDSCDKVAFSFFVNTKDAKILDIDEEQSFILYKDEDIYLYHIKTGKKRMINIKNKYYEYKIGFDNIKKNVVGIIYKNKKDDKYSYYNIELDKVIYNNKYEQINNIGEGYLSTKIDKKSYLVSNTEDKEYLTTVSCSDYIIKGMIDGYYIIENNSYNDKNTIYTSDFKKIASNIHSSNYSIDDSAFLYINEDNRIVKYDSNGKKKNKTTRYDEIMDLIDEYAIVINDNKLMIVSNNNLVVNLGKWRKEYVYDYSSGYHKRPGKEGIFVVIRYNKDVFDGIEYYFDPYNGRVEKRELKTIMEN